MIASFELNPELSSVNPKKKIGIVVNDLVQGGVSQFLLNYCKQLDYARYDYHLIVLSSDKDPQIEQAFIATGIPFTNFRIIYYQETNVFKQLLNRIRITYNVRWNNQFAAVIKDLKLDGLFAHCHIQFLPYMRQTKLPVVFVSHLVISRKPGNLLNFLIQKNAYTFYLKKTLVISVSESVSRFFHDFKLISKLKGLYEEPNKIPRKEEQIEYRDEVKRVAYVARISAVKNHLELLKAWKELNQPGITLQIIGPNDLLPEARQELEQYHAENVAFLGARSDVAELLLQADLAVFPSKAEGLPLALLEKMGCGLPVVASNIPELTSIIQDAENGLIYELGNPSDLASKLRILISDPEKRIKLGNAARQTVLKSFAYAPGEPLTLYEKKIDELF